jgi:peptidoglycan/xylan/chitin deacetylase (PgdA/CDA1 family)
MKYCETGGTVKPKPATIVAYARSWLRHAYLSCANTIPRKVPREFVRCLYCHYVFQDQVEKFRQFIKELRNMGDIISTNTLLDIINNGKSDGRYFHLSFDDGFRNIATLGASVLNETSTPSLFFVPADVIGRTGEDEIVFSHGTAPDGMAVQIASWEELRQAQLSGMTIGCHTMTHARLSDLDQNELNREIVDSKVVIERELGRKCDYFSWPFGRDSDISHQALQLIRNSGYIACFSAIRGSVGQQTDRFRIPRHHFELYWPLSHLRYFANGGRDSW